jgi:hypothetical protein
MEKIQTAEGFFDGNNGLHTSYSVKDKEGKFVAVVSYEKAIEFAKLHAEAALKAAHLSLQLPIEDLEFTLEVYPLDNIK